MRIIVHGGDTGEKQVPKKSDDPQGPNGMMGESAIGDIISP
jgi:hypothetical protein